MAEKPTVIIVGHTEEDENGNLFVTPQGGSDAIKIASKRSQLFPLFEQGRAVALDWQTYKGYPYVANAKSVSAELADKPPGEKDDSALEHSAEQGYLVQEAQKAGAKVESTQSKYKADPNKTASIEGQTALIQAVLRHQGKQSSDNDIVATAKRFMNFLKEKE